MPTTVSRTPGRKAPLEVIRKYWRSILVTVLAVVVLISLLHGWAEAHLEHWDEVSSKTTVIGDPSKKGLSGVAWLEPLPVQPNQTLYWRVELRNSFDQSIRVSIDELWHPGLSPKEAGGSSAVVRSAKDKKNEPGRLWTTWTRVLEPEEETAFWTRWRVRSEAAEAEEEAGFLTGWIMGEPRALGLSLVLSWQNVTGAEARGTVATNLRDIQVLSPWRTFWAHAIKCFVALLGILTVPVILAAAGFWFQQHHQSAEQRRQETQAEIERERQDNQAKIDHQRQIWAKMLPTSHDLNMKYYIPLKSTITTFQRDRALREHALADNNHALADQAFQTSFHYLLLTLRQLRFITVEAGGFYFKSRDGEKLFSEMINSFTSHVLRLLTPYEDLSALLDAMEPTDTVSTLQNKLESGEEVKKHAELKEKFAELKGKFAEWIHGDQQWAFQILFSAKLLLGFEVNRIYADWYEGPEDWPEGLSELLREWGEQDHSETTRSLIGRLEKYRRDVERKPRTRGWSRPATNIRG